MATRFMYLWNVYIVRVAAIRLELWSLPEDELGPAVRRQVESRPNSLEQSVQVRK